MAFAQGVTTRKEIISFVMKIKLFPLGFAMEKQCIHFPMSYEI
jgi:hypothetical protein